jgi:hypothetical protein
MKNLLAATAALAIGAAIASPASAGVLYNNLDPSSGDGDCSFSTTCAASGPGDDFAAQLFTLGATATVLSGAFTELDGNPTGTTSVNYAFYNDVSGLPSGAALFSGSSSVTTTSLGTSSGYNLNLESFNTVAATLAAGSYFFAIQSVSPDFATYLEEGLVQSGAAETHDGGVTWGANYEGFGGISVALYSNSISATPLPSTWTMLIAGFVGLGFFAYRGSKKNVAALAA